MFDDRLEVDSPGTFAGMVKKENIRYTHFSRNPKIAAFLKDYGYVKEYGEGVDRMCKELEAIGLPDPVFNNNTFILKSTVMSSAYSRKIADSTEKLPIEGIKVADLTEKLPIEGTKVADSTEKLPVKISRDFLHQNCYKLQYNEPTIRNLDRIHSFIDVNQVFGSAYLVKILECSERTARNLISKLRELEVIVPVSGQGKGVYRFKYQDEI